MKIVVTNGWVKEWERCNTFTIIFDTETEENRKALLECMRDGKSLKVTIEEVDE